MNTPVLVQNHPPLYARVALLLCLLGCLHYCCTWMRFRWQLGRKATGSGPAIPPTFFPYVADHVIQILVKPAEFLRSICNEARRPVALSVFGKKIQIAMPGEQTSWLFRNSAQLAPNPSLLDALTRFFGLSKEDQLLFSPAGVDQSRVTLKDQSRDFAKYLRGKNLTCIMNRFQENFEKELDLRHGADWARFPDMYKLIAPCIFQATVKALYGEGIFQVCPNLTDHYFEFYDCVPLLSKRLPAWLTPVSHRAQRRIQNDFMAWGLWCQTMERKAEDLDGMHSAEYEPLLGSLYIRRMRARHETLGLSEQGAACAMLGYMFVTVANMIPLTLWMLLYILLDPELNDRIRCEIEQLPGDDPMLMHDRPAASFPLLNAVYCEVLRLHTASTIGRTPMVDVHLRGGWTLPAEVPIFAINWMGGLSDSFWNTGGRAKDGTPVHPITSFWADRFLKCKDKNPTGPFLVDTEASNGPDVNTTDSGTQQVITKGNGLEGHWFPFGGGAYRCPGEALAKQTIMASVVTVLKTTEIKLVDAEAAGATKSNHRTLPFGSHTFDRPVPIEVRAKGQSLL